MKQKKDMEKEKILKKIKSGLRLKTKAPSVFRDKSKYFRKKKHK
jgi:hypothetical protein